MMYDVLFFMCEVRNVMFDSQCSCMMFCVRCTIFGVRLNYERFFMCHVRCTVPVYRIRCTIKR